MNDIVAFSPKQLSLIQRTVAKDANPTEFDLFVEMCRARGLNPLVRHAYCFIFHKNDPKKRQMVVVVSREGQRAIAERTGSYRPDERAPRFEKDDSLKDPRTNPAGLISAEVSVYKHTHGGWFPVTEVAYYEEYAPLVPIWENGERTDKLHLDPKKDGWRKMPRIMLAKCAEMAALRKAFPDDFGGLYGEGEIDRGDVLDLTPTELAEQADQDDRLAKIGGADAIMIDWLDGSPLDRVPVGQFADRVMAFVNENQDSPNTLLTFRDRNKHSMREFWAKAPADAHELKKPFEAAEKQVRESQVDLEDAIAEAG